MMRWLKRRELSAGIITWHAWRRIEESVRSCLTASASARDGMASPGVEFRILAAKNTFDEVSDNQMIYLTVSMHNVVYLPV